MLLFVHKISAVKSPAFFLGIFNKIPGINRQFSSSIQMRIILLSYCLIIPLSFIYFVALFGYKSVMSDYVVG